MQLRPRMIYRGNRVVDTFDDGRRLIVMDEQRTVYITDLASKLILQDSGLLQIDVDQCTLNNEETRFLAADTKFETISEWDTETGQLLRTIDSKLGHLPIHRLRWPGDLAVGANDTKIFVHNLSNGHITEIEASIPAYLNTDKYSIALNQYRTTVKVWPDVNYNNTTSIESTTDVSSIMLLESLILTGDVHGLICVWNKYSREKIRELRFHSEAIKGMNFILGRLVSIDYDYVCCVWDIYTGNLVQHFQFMQDACYTCCRNGDMITSTAAGHVQMWSLHTGKLLFDKNYNQPFKELKVDNVNRVIINTDVGTVFFDCWEVGHSVFAICWALGDWDFGVGRRLLGLLTP